MKLAKKNGIANLWVSNGFMSHETRKLILPYLDGINIDLKAFSENFYRKVCKARLAPVLDNIEFFSKKPSVNLELTTLIVPEENDSAKELKAIAKFIYNLSPNIPWHLSAFAPEISYKMQTTPATSGEKLKEAYEIGKEMGLKYVYARDFITKGLEDTNCPKCNRKLIERNFAFETNIVGLKKSKCKNCGYEIAGKF